MTQHPEPLTQIPPTGPGSAAGSGPLAGSIELPDAARLLESLGFVSHANLPHSGPLAHLVVGLRPTPTLQHFDPREIHYWVADGGRGRARELALAGLLRADSEFSWGRLEIVDRHLVTNTWLTFGGRLLQDLVGDERICRFVSPAPILRSGGHSQVYDLGAATIGGFFARLMIAIDYQPGFEQQLTAATPLARYSSFLADFRRRCEASIRFREADEALVDLLDIERERVRTTSPADWAAGLELLAAAQPEPTVAVPG